MKQTIWEQVSAQTTNDERVRGKYHNTDKKKLASLEIRLEQQFTFAQILLRLEQELQIPQGNLLHSLSEWHLAPDPAVHPSDIRLKTTHIIYLLL